MILFSVRMNREWATIDIYKNHSFREREREKERERDKREREMNLYLFLFLL